MTLTITKYPYLKAGRVSRFCDVWYGRMARLPEVCGRHPGDLTHPEVRLALLKMERAKQRYHSSQVKLLPHKASRLPAMS